MVSNSQVMIVLPLFPLISYSRAVRKTRRRNTNSTLSEYLIQKYSMCGKEVILITFQVVQTHEKNSLRKIYLRHRELPFYLIQ